MSQGNLYILSAPSGAGKSSLISALLEKNQGTKKMVSISHTTRSPRPGESHGVHYYFVSVEEFETLIEKGHFLEYAKVYDNYYGTPKEHVMNLLEEGKSVILEIDIQGAMKVKESYSDAVFIYVVPPSLDVLTSRLHGRGTDDKEVIHKRLSLACSELALAHRYDYIVVNDDLEDAIERTASILRAETCKISRNKEKIQYIYKRYSNEQGQQ